MTNSSTAISNVIPFKFEAREVRTLLIDDQPWFVAADVAAALEYRMAADMTRNLDDDERGTQIVRTPSKNQHGEFGTVEQAMLVINESGLYSAILRSRKAEAKRFKKWVTSEVLPAIRKHGYYADHSNQMTDLVHTVIGTTGEVVLDRVIEQKAGQIPSTLRRSFSQTMKSRLRSRFNVQKTALIPAESLADACNFIVAYNVEGEWIPGSQEDRIEYSKVELPEPASVHDRWLVSYDWQGKQHIQQVPRNARVMTDTDLLKSLLNLLAEPGELMIHTRDLLAAMSALTDRLGMRIRERPQYVA